jgi:hypothetical protein
VNIFSGIGAFAVNILFLFGIASTSVPSFAISSNNAITGWVYSGEPGLDQIIFNQQCILDESVLQLYSAPHILEVMPVGYAKNHRYYVSCWLVDSKSEPREIWVESTLPAQDMRFGSNYLTNGEHFRVSTQPVPMAGE